MDPQGPKINPKLVLLAVQLGFMSYGWDAGVLGGVLGTTAFQSAMKYPSTTVLSMIIAAFLLASWLGCLITAIPMADRFGRRTWVMLGAAIQIVGTAISVSSYSPGQMITGRIVIGIGNGFVVATGPVYIAETTAHTKMRGPLVGILLGFACVGTTLAYWIDFGFTYASGQVVWRLPVALQIVWSVLTIGFLWPNADSPRWYFLRNRGEEGYAVLIQLYPDEQTALKVKSEILIELHQEKKERLRFWDFFYDNSQTKAARRIRTGVILVGVAYLMGTNMIFYYMPTMFQVYIGLDAVISSILSGAATTLLALGVFFGSVLCEKTGRRRGLLWGAAFQTVFMLVFVILLARGTKAATAGAAAMLFGWILVFSLTWAPITYIYVSETMPLQHRHTGAGCSMSSQWLMAFLTVFAGPIGYEHVQWRIFIWFVVFNFAGFFYVYFSVPETGGRSLEHMNELFNNNLAVDVDEDATRSVSK